jgi:hypothetical protein
MWITIAVIAVNVILLGIVSIHSIGNHSNIPVIIRTHKKVLAQELEIY